MIQILQGDCREVLKTLPDCSVHCCVTSPPYFGLRDYGCAGQIGLESTPDAYVAELVAVFREVKRVLRDDGTLWLNLGDSYASNGERSNNNGEGKSTMGWVGQRHETLNKAAGIKMPAVNHGLKPKDLIGIPWRVAFALQQPYYTGVVGNEADRVWLAAMLDAEGSIVVSEYTTGGRVKNNVYIGITNSSVPIIEKCERLFPQEGNNVYRKANPVNREVFRWDVERMDTKALFLREVYPYLVAKRKQAILAYTFVEMQRGLPSKKKGYLPEQREQRTWIAQAMSRLNAGEDVDLPGWVVEPPSLFEPGFYLRQDIIWAKGVSGDAARAGWSGNPMPESVTDRCTKAHEYIFLLAKSPRYYYDAEAIKEDVAESQVGRVRDDVIGGNKGDDVHHSPGGRYSKGRGGRNAFRGQGHFRYGENGPANRAGRNMKDIAAGEDKRNRRSVWTVTTKPYREAHFATFPPDLIQPCIRAGCPAGGTVLDPFGGSGTTGEVAASEGRKAILIELNPQYVKLAQGRGGLFCASNPRCAE